MCIPKINDFRKRHFPARHTVSTSIFQRTYTLYAFTVNVIFNSRLWRAKVKHSILSGVQTRTIRSINLTHRENERDAYFTLSRCVYIYVNLKPTCCILFRLYTYSMKIAFVESVFFFFNFHHFFFYIAND